MTMKELYDWTIDDLLEVNLEEPDDFLRVKETLTRIGLTNQSKDTLYQSCHILHKRGRYFIVHFKELFALDGKPANILVDDIKRRNTIAKLLADWNLVTLVSKIDSEMTIPVKSLKIISYDDKRNWNLESKYQIGNKKRNS